MNKSMILAGLVASGLMLGGCASDKYATVEDLAKVRATAEKAQADAAAAQRAADAAAADAAAAKAEAAAAKAKADEAATKIDRAFKKSMYK